MSGVDRAAGGGRTTAVNLAPTTTPSGANTASATEPVIEAMKKRPRDVGSEILVGPVSKYFFSCFRRRFRVNPMRSDAAIFDNNSERVK
jgi:hypothetical protein